MKAVLDGGDPAVESRPTTVEKALRKRDMTVGASVMFLLVLVAMLISMPLPQYAFSRFFVVLFAWVGLVLAVNARSIINYFTRPAVVEDKSGRNEISARAVNALGWKPLETAEVKVDNSDRLRPASVTERTTNLLDD